MKSGIQIHHGATLLLLVVGIDLTDELGASVDNKVVRQDEALRRKYPVNFVVTTKKDSPSTCGGCNILHKYLCIDDNLTFFAHLCTCVHAHARRFVALLKEMGEEVTTTDSHREDPGKAICDRAIRSNTVVVYSEGTL